MLFIFEGNNVVEFEKVENGFILKNQPAELLKSFCNTMGIGNNKDKKIPIVVSAMNGNINIFNPTGIIDINIDSEDKVSGFINSDYFIHLENLLSKEKRFSKYSRSYKLISNIYGV